MLQSAGHQVTGLDSYLFETCVFGEDVPDIPALDKDVRDITPDDVAGFDAVIHLAALSNDPLGDFDASITYDINFEASAASCAGGEAGGRAAFPLLVVVQRLRSQRRRGSYGRGLVQSRDAVCRLEDSLRGVDLEARGRRLQPDVPAQRHRLRRLAAAARRPRGQQPRGLGSSRPATY